jgi:acetolactate synthase-1/2/3 large subunit
MENIQYFWDFLRRKNINIVFGVPGGAIADLLSKKPQNMNWKNVGQELQNGFIASVLGYYTKNVGCLFVTTGPGVATPLSAIENARAENQPLMIINTYNPNVQEDFQWWSIEQIKNTIHNTFHIQTSEEFIPKLSEAYHLAKGNTSVLLLINIHILRQPIPKSIDLKDNSIEINHNQKIIHKINCKFCDRKILIVIGKGNYFNYDIVKDFIIRNKLPYVTTWKQRFIIENSYYCGRLGSLGHHSANWASINANRILIIGDVSGILTSPFFANKFSFIRYNPKSIVYSLSNKIYSNKDNYNKHFITNDIDTILNGLHMKPNKKWRKSIKTAFVNLYFDLPRTSVLEKYIYAAALVYKQKNLQIPVTTGVGNHWYCAGKYFDISKPEMFESTTNWSSIGTGVANGIGMNIAISKPVWIIEGDGGFAFSFTTFLYLLQNPNLPFTITIFADKSYSAIIQTYVTRNFQNNESNDVPFNDWIKILPNYQIFTNETDYYNYLNQNPISDYVRYLICEIDNSNLEGSLVYEINMDNKYIQYARENNYEKMINAPYIL